MQIRVNGKMIETRPDLSVDGLLDELGYTDRLVAVAVNQQCILRKNYPSHLIGPQDEIEILAPMAGG